MLTVLTSLINEHGIANVQVSIKPHGESIAAVINLIPDPAAVPDAAMKAALAAPITLIGEDAIQSASVESVLERVRSSMANHSYFSADAVAKRLTAASTKNPVSPAKQGKNDVKVEQKKVPAPSPAVPDSMDDIFNQDSL
jgi:hypothetical protein